MKTSTIFTTCVHEFNESYLEKWMESSLPMVMYVEPLFFEKIKEYTKNTNIICQQLPLLSNQVWYDTELSELPSSRNETKDSPEHIWNTHLKVLCTNLTIEYNDKYEYYAYVDFDVPGLIKNESTWKYLRTTFNEPYLFIKNYDSRIFLPGCWIKSNMEFDFANKINWRFCGSFFIGNKIAISHFYSLYKTHFKNFLHTVQTLTWEVNFWSWLECQNKWEPYWFPGDHNDSMFFIPSIYGYYLIKDKSKIVKYDYPNFSPYRPMSASYVKWNNLELLNTRFVNYWIYDSGSYYYPDDEHVIRSYNILSKIIDHTNNIPVPISYDIMNNNNPPYNTKDEIFSEGIEDIRIYVSQQTNALMFIGSTLQFSYCDKIRIVIGEYDIENKLMTNMRIIKPPSCTWCEKNWCPIPLPDNSDGFVYKWYPLQIGKVYSHGENENLGELKIIFEKQTDDFFRNVKGSTPFEKYDDNSLIGIVHFSEETHPRSYFHKIIIFEKNTFEIIKTSRIFCFKKCSVEFCIGFRVKNERIGFWISQMDRDPLYLELETKELWN